MLKLRAFAVLFGICISGTTACSQSASVDLCAPGLGLDQVMQAAQDNPALAVEPPGTTSAGSITDECNSDQPAARTGREYVVDGTVDVERFLADAGRVGDWTRVAADTDHCWVRPIDGELAVLRAFQEQERVVVSISLGAAASACLTQA